MGYNNYEVSEDEGSPVELYEFSFQGTTYYYTSGESDFNYNTKTYTAESIGRTEIEFTGDLPKNDLTLTVPYNFPIALLFRVAPPSDVVHLIVREIHRADTIDNEAIVKWRGRVLNARWNEDMTVSLNCENFLTSMRRTGLRRLYQRQCPHILYGNACGLANTSFAISAQLTSGGGVSLQSPTFLALGDDFLAGGYVEWEKSPGVYERRAIRSHTGDTIEITYPIPELTSLDTVTVYPGCDHTLDTCRSKFNNVVNYGGFPYIPQKNPFGGNSVF